MSKHADHTGQGGRSSNVDAPNSSMRPCASEQRCVQHSVQVDVIDISPAARQKPCVLPPQNRFTDVRRHVSVLPRGLNNRFNDAVAHATAELQEMNSPTYSRVGAGWHRKIKHATRQHSKAKKRVQT